MPGYKRKRAGAGAYTSKKRKVAPTVKKYVKRQLGKRLERKYINREFSLTPSTTGVISKVMDANPAPGNSDSGRIGDRIRITSIDMRYTGIYADGTNFVRIIVFQWKDDDNNYTPVQSDVINASTSAFTAQIRHDQRKAGMLNILWDKVHCMSSTGSNAAIFRHKFFTRGFGRDVQFMSGSQKGTNQLYMLTISDSIAASHPSLDVRFRVNYTDA